MLALIGTVLVTSFLDSLNPSAIAQELLLLAIAPEKRDVWWFITGIAPANLALGLAIYLGIATIVTEVVSSLLVCLPASRLRRGRNLRAPAGGGLRAPRHTDPLTQRSAVPRYTAQAGTPWPRPAFCDRRGVLRR